jgi:hypothetical protein
MADWDATDVFSGTQEAEASAPETGQTDETQAEGTPAQTPVDAWDVPGVGKVNRDELIKGYLRTQDYTRKTMAISQQQREYDMVKRQGEAMEAALIQARNLLTNRQQLQEYLKQMPGAEPEIPADQIMTAADAQALMRRQIGESQQNFEKRLQQAEERIITQAYQSQYESAINNTLRTIGDRYPELRTIPGMEVLLRQAVGSQQPGDLDQALALFEQAAQFYSGRLKGAVAKQVMGSPNNPLRRGIEPPAVGTPAPEDNGDNYSGVKDPMLRNLVLKDVERALFGGRTG